MDLITCIRILNRLVESGVSLNKAYWGVFGDNMEVCILAKIVAHDASSQTLINKASTAILKAA